MADTRIRFTAVLLAAITVNGLTQDTSRPLPSLALLAVGEHALRIISPAVLELSLVIAKKPDPAPVEQWNFVTDDGKLRLPAAKEFSVRVNGTSRGMKSVGFRRHPLCSPLRQRDD